MDTQIEIKPYIRWTISQDLPEIHKIEEDVFEFPWSEQDFRNVYKARNAIGLTVTLNTEIVGYIIYQLHHAKLEILNLAIKKEHQRTGIGKEVINKIKTKLSLDKRTNVSIIVREENLPAQLFLKSQGFKYIKTIKNYYDQVHEDAYYFRYSI